MPLLCVTLSVLLRRFTVSNIAARFVLVQKVVPEDICAPTQSNTPASMKRRRRDGSKATESGLTLLFTHTRTLLSLNAVTDICAHAHKNIQMSFPLQNDTL